jgi:hypothetical protein
VELRVAGHEPTNDADKQADGVLQAFVERRESLMAMRDKLRAKEGLRKLEDDCMVPTWVAEACDRAKARIVAKKVQRKRA